MKSYSTSLFPSLEIIVAVLLVVSEEKAIYEARFDSAMNNFHDFVPLYCIFAEKIRVFEFRGIGEVLIITFPNTRIRFLANVSYW